MTGEDVPYRVVEAFPGSWFPNNARPNLSLLIDVFAGAIFLISFILGFWQESIFVIPTIVVPWFLMRRYVASIERQESVKARYKTMWNRCSPQSPKTPAQSPAETLFHAACARAGLPVYGQQVASEMFRTGRTFVADFAYYEPSSGLRIALEIDGQFKFESKDLMDRMDRRDNYFKENGWYVFRFHARDCHERPDYCVSQATRLIGQYSREHQAELDLLCGSDWKAWAGELISGRSA